MLTLEQAREALRLDNTDNDDIITGLLPLPESGVISLAFNLND